MRQVWATQVWEIQDALLRYNPNIVHICGHSRDSGEFVLETDEGMSHPVSVTALSKYLGMLSTNVQCVVLNTCYSSEQAKEIVKYIDCVISHGGLVIDGAARKFSWSFYNAIAYNFTVKRAYDLAAALLEMEGMAESKRLSILHRTGNPDLVAFTNPVATTSIPSINLQLERTNTPHLRFETEDLALPASLAP